MPEKHENFFIAVNIANIISAAFALLTSIKYFKLKIDRFNILPRSLRYYLNTCFFPFMIIFNILSIYVSVSFLIYKDPSRFDYKLFRSTLTFVSNQLRMSLLTTVIERIIATVYLEKYGKYSGNIFLYIILCLSSFLLSGIYSMISVTWIFFESEQSSYLFTIYLLVAIHIITLIICRILHLKSKSMYKLLAYRVSLQRRHQIAVNIKILTFLWPTILIFSTIGSIGPFFVWLYHLFTNNTSTFGILQTGYNTTFGIMMIFRMKHLFKRKNHITTTSSAATDDDGFQMRIISVTSPFGKVLPTALTSEIYFEDLRKQWS